MKKRVFIILMSVTLAGVITGCGSLTQLVSDSAENVKERILGNSEEEENAESWEEQDETEESESREDQDETEGASGEENFEEGFVHDFRLPYAYDAETIFTVDDKGNKVREISLSEVNDAIKKIADIKEAVSGYMVKAVSGDIVFVYINPYDGTESTVYAVDLGTGEAEALLETKYSVDYIDVYEGKAYIGVSKYKTSEDDNVDFKEYAVSKKDDGSGYEVEENEYESLESYFKQYTLVETHANVGYEAYDNSHCFSLKRTMDNIGFVVAHKVGVTGGGYCVIDSDGEKYDLDMLDTDGSATIYAYDKNWMIYGITSENRSETEYSLFDFEKKASTPIDIKSIGYVEMNSDGCRFVSRSEDFGSNAIEVYDYDFKSGNLKNIFSKGNVPLSERDTAAACIFGDNLFYQSLDESSLKWSRYDLLSGETQDVDCVIKEIKAYNYGKISFDSKTENCPKCGVSLYKVYAESFALDSKYSDHADEINAFFEDEFKGRLDISSGDSAMGDSTCEEHQEYPEQYCETNEYYVEDVNILKGRYLTVDCSSYWYGGGAHGMPGKDQYVFDLQTGKRMEMKDFYSGSEEDFKKLVAEKTKEDYLETNDGYKYFATDADEAYDTAYEYVSLNGTVFFKEDCVIYSFAPYDMGPFASGYIDIKLPIEEFEM